MKIVISFITKPRLPVVCPRFIFVFFRHTACNMQHKDSVHVLAIADCRSNCLFGEPANKLAIDWDSSVTNQLNLTKLHTKALWIATLGRFRSM